MTRLDSTAHLFAGLARLKLAFVSAATQVLAGLLLIVSSGSALAVKGEVPTAVCDAAKCETCLEYEAGGRCLKCGIDPQCLGGDPGLSSDFTEMLNAHNGYRARHVVPALAWSSQIAKGAQDWANACTPDPKNKDLFAHSPNAFGSYGENLFWGSRTAAHNAVDWWYAEIKNYDFNNPYASFKAGDTDSSKEVRHFTQVVWRDSKELGCAVANCGGRNFWVCRYSPPGNFNAQNPGVLAANVPPPGGMPQTQSIGSKPQSTGGVTPQSTMPNAATVNADVDVYDAPGGNGNAVGVLRKGKTVGLSGSCSDNWCNVEGNDVPGGKGWVYDGDDYDSLKY